jgi:hypothetical protein
MHVPRQVELPRPNRLLATAVLVGERFSSAVDRLLTRLLRSTLLALPFCAASLIAIISSSNFVTRARGCYMDGPATCRGAPCALACRTRDQRKRVDAILEARSRKYGSTNHLSHWVTVRYHQRPAHK